MTGGRPVSTGVGAGVLSTGRVRPVAGPTGDDESGCVRQTDIEEHGEETDRLREERERRQEAEAKKRLDPFVKKLMADPRFSGPKVGRAKRQALAEEMFPDEDRKVLSESEPFYVGDGEFSVELPDDTRERVGPVANHDQFETVLTELRERIERERLVGEQPEQRRIESSKEVETKPSRRADASRLAAVRIVQARQKGRYRMDGRAARMYTIPPRRWG